MNGGSVSYDMAFGGNFYALLPAADAGLDVDPARAPELIERGLEIMAAINAAERPVHPGDGRIAGCRHVVFTAPARTGRARSGAPPPSTPAGSTARPAAPGRPPSWPSCTRAVSWAWGRSS